VNGEIKTQFTSKADGKCVHTTCIMCVTKETTQQIQLNAGPNTITVNTTTQDGWYHQDAYFRVRFQEASCDADCSVCELTGGGLITAGESSDDTGNGFTFLPSSSPVEAPTGSSSSVPDASVPGSSVPASSAATPSPTETAIICPAVYDPVCCDTKEYSNQCVAGGEGFGPQDCTQGVCGDGPTASPVLIKYIKPTVDGVPSIGPTECPNDILLLKHHGVTTYPENSIRILSQDETTVTVELLQLFTTTPTSTIDYIFYQYNVNVFNNKCYEEDNVVGGESITEITIQCTRTSQVAFLELWIADDGTKGVLDEEGDTAVIPNCCYPDAVPKGTPVTFYNIEIKCISECQGQIY